MSVQLHPSYSKRLKQLTDAVKYENGYADAKRRLKELDDGGMLESYLHRLLQAVKTEFASQIYRVTPYYQEEWYFNKSSDVPSPTSDPHE